MKENRSGHQSAYEHRTYSICEHMHAHSDWRHFSTHTHTHARSLARTREQNRLLHRQYGFWFCENWVWFTYDATCHTDQFRCFNWIYSKYIEKCGEASRRGRLFTLENWGKSEFACKYLSFEINSFLSHTKVSTIQNSLLCRQFASALFQMQLTQAHACYWADNSKTSHFARWQVAVNIPRAP